MADPDRIATLIVEDDPMFRSRFEEILSRADGYRIVASAASVADGIAAARANRIDLLVVDLGLPDPVADRLLARLELSCQFGNATACAVQLDDLSPKLRRVLSSCHCGLLLLHHS